MHLQDFLDEDIELAFRHVAAGSAQPCRDVASDFVGPQLLLTFVGVLAGIRFSDHYDALKGEASPEAPLSAGLQSTGGCSGYGRPSTQLQGINHAPELHQGDLTARDRIVQKKLEQDLPTTGKLKS